MNNKALKNILVTAALIGAAGQSSLTFGHDVLDARLGTRAGAMDKYTVSCAAAPISAEVEDSGPADKLRISVRDQNLLNGGINNTAKVRIIAFKVSGNAATNATLAKLRYDSLETDNAYSSFLDVNSSVNGGDGDYEIYVTKNLGGAEDYDLIVHCQTNVGAHTGTTEPLLVVDQ